MKSAEDWAIELTRRDRVISIVEFFREIQIDALDEAAKIAHDIKCRLNEQRDPRAIVAGFIVTDIHDVMLKVERDKLKKSS